MIYLIKYCIIFFSILTLFSCKRGESIQVTKKEYHHKKSDGFWVIRNKKAIKYNQQVAKPRRDRDINKLRAENRRILKHNQHHKKKYDDNQELLKTFDHH